MEPLSRERWLTAVVPYSCFSEIREELTEFGKRQDLNRYQRRIVEERYHLNPVLDFTPRSLVTVVTPQILIQLIFSWEGRRFPSVSEIGVEEKDVLTYLAEGNDHHYYFHFWLPQKRIAVRSGLVDYGRNNITYAPKMGSSINLACFISDRPASEKYTWRPVTMLPLCEGCDICLHSCPTGTILPDRFLIDNEKCLSYFNEGDGELPPSIPPKAHHRTINCSLCQEPCPANQEVYAAPRRTIEYSEAETELLVAGVPLNELPEDLLAKVKDGCMDGYYSILARNLKALFASGNYIK